MALDLDYIPVSYFQQYFVDKDTGLPLAGGVVSFYQDSARTNPKPMYQLTGTPPNYTYVPLPTTMTLNSVGTFEDLSGNDIIPYFYPYDADGNVDLYYVTVFNADGVAQFTRTGIPNIGTEETITGEIVKNYIPNGQFLLHNNIVATSTTTPGQITQQLTYLADGQWQFYRPSNSTAADFVTFPSLISYTENPSASPKYYMNVSCVSPCLTDNYKIVRIVFYDVDKFASDIDVYTFFFSAINNIATTTVNINIRKYFGSGGSSQTITNVTSFNITPGWKNYSATFSFGDNVGKSIGSSDDFVSIEIALPTSLISNIGFVDFVLTPGRFNILDTFPTTPNNEFYYQSLFGATNYPNDGSDLYLPLIRTKQGIIARTPNKGLNNPTAPAFFNPSLELS